ncbi:MAG: hypothetical protein ACO3JL_15615, partial [Myxococcota bacterium]
RLLKELKLTRRAVDGGEGSDAGGSSGGDPTLDSDGDTIPDVEDNCIAKANDDQADFDQDRVGDLCDLCPVAVTGREVDEDGCPLPTEQERDLVRAIALAIAQGDPATTELDLDQSGELDVGDLDIAIGRIYVALQPTGDTP